MPCITARSPTSAATSSHVATLSRLAWLSNTVKLATAGTWVFLRKTQRRRDCGAGAAAHTRPHGVMATQAISPPPVASV